MYSQWWRYLAAVLTYLDTVIDSSAALPLNSWRNNGLARRASDMQELLWTLSLLSTEDRRLDSDPARYSISTMRD